MSKFPTPGQQVRGRVLDMVGIPCTTSLKYCTLKLLHALNVTFKYRNVSCAHNQVINYAIKV